MLVRLVAVVLLLSVALAGCQPKGQEPPKPTPSPALQTSEKPVNETAAAESLAQPDSLPQSTESTAPADSQTTP